MFSFWKKIFATILKSARAKGVIQNVYSELEEPSKEFTKNMEKETKYLIKKILFSVIGVIGIYMFFLGTAEAYQPWNSLSTQITVTVIRIAIIVVQGVFAWKFIFIEGVIYLKVYIVAASILVKRTCWMFFFKNCFVLSFVFLVFAGIFICNIFMGSPLMASIIAYLISMLGFSYYGIKGSNCINALVLTANKNGANIK